VAAMLCVLFALAFMIHASHSDILKGKTVLVTGASRGIGEAISREFATAGLNVVVCARRKSDADLIVSEIKQSGGSAISVVVDVSSKDDVAHAYKVAEEAFGPVHFSVANAGTVGNNLDLGSADAVDDMENVIKTNVLGTMYQLKEAVVSSRKVGGGAFIAVSSLAGSAAITFFQPGPFSFPPTSRWISYCSSKAAVDSIARSGTGLAQENFRVYSVAPHVYETRMARSAASGFSINTSALSSVNPFFKEPGDPRDIARIMMAIFDNSTQYSPGSLIMCDHHLTFDGHEYHKHMYTGKQYELDKNIARDFQGKPYIWPDEEDSKKTDL